MKRVFLNIGDMVVTDEPALIETVLGSCVSVCLWDEHKRRGGINHFLLPRYVKGMMKPCCCGTESVRMLLNSLIDTGSDVANINAKVFGGGRVLKELVQGAQIGRENVKVAKQILAEYCIPVVSEHTGNDYGLKIKFYTDSGRIFIKKLLSEECTPFTVDPDIKGL